MLLEGEELAPRGEVPWYLYAKEGVFPKHVGNEYFLTGLWRRDPYSWWLQPCGASGGAVRAGESQHCEDVQVSQAAHVSASVSFFIFLLDLILQSECYSVRTKAHLDTRDESFCDCVSYILKI